MSSLDKAKRLKLHAYSIKTRNPRIVFTESPSGGKKIYILFSGATFHIPLTKSATLKMLLHCSLWQFSGSLFWILRALFFCISGAKSPVASVYFFPWSPWSWAYTWYIYFFFFFFLGGGGYIFCSAAELLPVSTQKGPQSFPLNLKSYVKILPNFFLNLPEFSTNVDFSRNAHPLHTAQYTVAH